MPDPTPTTTPETPPAETEFDSLDMGEGEATPEPPPEKPRDETGKFVAGPPADMPDPTKTRPEEKPEPERTIPLASHLEERNRLRAELAHRDEQIGLLTKRVEAVEHPPEKPQPEPDFTEDPKGYIDAQTAKVSKALDEIKAETRKVGEAAGESKAQAQQTQFMHELASTESAFVKDHADYYDAMSHIRVVRAEQLLLADPKLTQEQVIAQLQKEELLSAAQLLRMGRNPHEFAYHYAKTIGYRPKATGNGADTPIPPAPTETKGDPGTTLGTSGKAPEEPDEDALSGDDTADIIQQALAERFKRPG